MLFIVMPFFNEEDCLRTTCLEWYEEVSSHGIDFRILLLDDCSTDGSAAQAAKLMSEIKQIIVLRQERNLGHGQACLRGYSYALKEGATWILQIDSDGQCEPAYFGHFWERAKHSKVIYGYRVRRRDGLHRLIFSRLFASLCYLISGTYVRDPNVPYRLMHRDSLESLLPQIQRQFYLANVAVSFLQNTSYKVEWVNLEFRERSSGRSKTQLCGLFMNMIDCLGSLRALKKGTKIST